MNAAAAPLKASPPDVLETRFVLPVDVMIVPVRSLSERVRSQLANAGAGEPATTGALAAIDDDFAVARPQGRRPASLVDPPTAALLGEFRQPSRLVDAVVRFSQAQGRDPATMLDAAFEVLQRFCNGKLLVPEGSGEEAAIRPSFAPGQLLDRWEIVRGIHLLEDTELYQARDEDGRTVALKLWRSASDSDNAPTREQAGDHGPIRREAAILERLGGDLAPALLAQGEHDGRPYLVAEWRAGIPISAVADELRAPGARGARGAAGELLALARRLAAAYAELHERGVVHGDVHPGNLLVDGDGRITLLDFGAARLLDPASPYASVLRAAMPYYYDPQTAAAVLAGRMPPDPTTASDQYAVGVLLYRLCSGDFPADFPAEQAELMTAVIERPPLPFTQRGAEPWPALERVLRRAMAKQPAERFASLSELAAALATVEPVAEGPGVSEHAAGVPAAWTGSLPTAAPAGFSTDLLGRYGLSSRALRDGLPESPRASLWSGAAGVAWTYYRLATVRGDGPALALADAWASRATEHWSDPDSGFLHPPAGITAARVGAGSAFHAPAGLHAVRTLIDHARGDRGAMGESLGAFLSAASQRCEPAELALGRAGSLLAAGTLLEALAGSPVTTAGTATAADLGRALHSFVLRSAAELWQAVRASGELRECDWLPHLGMAHGWAGLLFSLLRAAEVTGSRPPRGLAGKLDELAAAAQPAGRGLLWPGTLQDPERVGRTPDLAPGWCSGSAGYVHLWIAAARGLDDERYATLAQRAAWATWEHPDTTANLCCGTAGRALALAAWYRHSGDPAWRDRARTLAQRSLERAATLPEQGLFKGQLGTALAAIELEQAEHARMPLFCAT